MSLFLPSGGTTGGSSGSLIPSLNLDTGSTDPAGKRKSIFEPSTSQRSLSTGMGGFPGFGGSSDPTTSAPSLFGTPATTTSIPTFTINKPSTTAPTTGGLFGTAPAATSAPSGSLFTNLGGNTSSAPSGGLFGNTAATTTAPSSGLFGGTTAPASGGLFGNNAPTTSVPTGGLFGATASKPATTSMFGQPAPATNTQPALGASMFGSTLGQTTNIQPSEKSQSREPAYFSSLLERQKKKVKFNVPTMSNLSSVNMDLGDLARKAQELGSKGSKPTAGFTDSRAHYLLSGSGVTPGKDYKAFQALDGDNIIPEKPSRQEFADEGNAYLKGIQTKGREAMLKESMDRVYREIDNFVEESLGINFEEQKQRIMEHFGLIVRDDDTESPSKSNFGRSRPQMKPGESTRSVLGRSGLEKSIIGTAGSVPGTVSFFGGNSTSGLFSSLGKNQTLRDLRDKERFFVEQVELLNKSRLNEENFAIMKAFASVESKAGGDSPKQLVDAYVALQEITRENESEAGIRERIYASDYLDDNSSSPAVTKLRRQILHKSRSYLEKSFYRELESTVEKNPRAAQLGGRPTVTNKIRAYIRVRDERHDLAPDGAELQQIGDNGDYCWILIFYLLRAGFVAEAAEYAQNDPAFQSTDRRFVSYLTSYANSTDRRLSRKLQEMIDGEYQQRSKNAPKNTVDPYRMACYKVIGRCDLSQRNLDSVGQGVEDWLWLQFCLARETDRSEDLSSDIFGLEQICETITEIGEKHFQKSQVDNASAYGTYFLMLILAGLFEQAVDYLHSFNSVSAVHFAISLNYYGLLRVSDYQTAGNELLTFTTTQLPQINFIPLIAYYTTSFRTALPVQAVDYLSLICLSSDLKPATLATSQTSACHECLRELCLETREFAALLGDIRGDGHRIPGAIEYRATIIRLDSHEEFLRSITSQAAVVADQRGQIADAVLLYHLCEDYDNVTNVLNRALADAVAVEIGDAPMSLQPLKPRQTPSPNSIQDGSPVSSLSLTQSTSSPVELAENMMGLYDTNAAYYGKISSNNRYTCRVLLKMLAARAKIESNQPQFLRALEELNELMILPLDAHGEIPVIRQMSSAFAVLPQLVARSAGLSILWCIRAIGGERDNLARQGGWIAYGTENDANQVRDQLAQMARDLMVFAGLVKYKLPGRVYDMLTRAGGDVGGY